SVARSFQPLAGMRLALSLPSAPSASTRDPLLFFNSLLRTRLPGRRLVCPQRVSGEIEARDEIDHPA
ncbi:MAG: hypothetical protein ACREIF_00825, partial [Chthoniobacterales bacterium]